jgi:threonine dehydrogenase-like Zn-dependent dehydrogenase
MKALAFVAPGKVELTDRDTPTTANGAQVLIRLEVSGICGTDRGIIQGHVPAQPHVILGHEAVGRVELTGPEVNSVHEGDRVVVNPTYYCGLCRPCRRGMTGYCDLKAGHELGIDRDGTFAEYILLHEKFVYRIRGDLPTAKAALIEPLTCILNNLEAVNLRWDDRIVIFGGGPIGTLCALLLSSRGLETIVVEASTERRALVSNILGGDVRVVEMETADSVPGNALFDVAVDTTGTLGWDAASLLAKGGRFLVMGFNDSHHMDISAFDLVTRGIRLLGVGDFAAAMFQSAVNLAEALPIERLVTHQMVLPEYEAAFRTVGIDLRRHQTVAYSAMKVLLEC